MRIEAWSAAFVFAATFWVLATGKVGPKRVKRGTAALVGGILTALLLRVHPRVIDIDVLLLLAGLMVVAGLAEAAGLFAGLRRRLVRLPPATALFCSVALVAFTSAALLNDAAVVVLVPFLLPMLRALRLPLVASVALLAVGANLGSLLTPFGNPQNAVLARAADLSTADFLLAQWPWVAFGLALLAVASWFAARGVSHEPPEDVPHATPRGRIWLVVCIVAFLAMAVAAPRWHLTLGRAAAVAAALAWAGLRPRLGREADKAARDGLDVNVILLFVGLYLLTGGLHAWFPADRLEVASLDTWSSAAAATTVMSNAVGNVPAVLVFQTLDPAWTVAHAMFLVTVSTMGGALLLTGSAASLLAADQARKLGVEVGFWPFLRHALWALPVLLLGAWRMW